jgi:hypothetical protein
MASKAGVKGGDKFQSTMGKMRNNLATGKGVRVGFLEGATYPDGTSVPYVAAINEFGNPENNQPARPYFRSMIAEKSPTWGASLAGVLKHNNYDVAVSMRLMGEGMAGQLQDSIREFYSPALSKVTVMLRGMKANKPGLVISGATVGQAAKRVAEGLTNYGASDKPLVDTKVMLMAVDYEVMTGEEDDKE